MPSSPKTYFSPVRTSAWVLTAFAGIAAVHGVYTVSRTYMAGDLLAPQGTQISMQSTESMPSVNNGYFFSSDAEAMQQSTESMPSVDNEHFFSSDAREHVQDPGDTLAMTISDDGEVQSITYGEASSMWANETIVPWEEDALSGLESSDGYEYIAETQCKNTQVKKAIVATGRTRKQQFSTTVTLPPTPTKPGQPPSKPQKVVVKESIAQRCTAFESEASAQFDALEAFVNACGLPPQCENLTQCLPGGVMFKKEPDPPKIKLDTRKISPSPTAMDCAGSVSYATTATAEGDCISVRKCQVRNIPLPPRY